MTDPLSPSAGLGQRLLLAAAALAALWGAVAWALL
jgi:hypothetical protein